MSITVEQVKKWYVHNGVGHVVMQAGGETRGVYTACRTLFWGSWEQVSDDRPPRICRTCRAALQDVHPVVSKSEGGAQ